MARTNALRLADQHRVGVRLLSLAALILIIMGQSLTGAPLVPA